MITEYRYWECRDCEYTDTEEMFRMAGLEMIGKDCACPHCGSTNVKPEIVDEDRQT
mgnify:CR=1 FL=1